MSYLHRFSRRMALALGIAIAGPVVAQETPEASIVETSAGGGDTAIGSVTNLPLPRYVSLKANEANVRRGPSLTHRIDWIFQRRSMPLRIVAEYGHWRRVVDRDGLGGWIHYSMLSGNRTVIVDIDGQPLFARADPTSPENAKVESGVVAELGSCSIDWCRINAGGYKGWVPKSTLWGVDPTEVRE